MGAYKLITPPAEYPVVLGDLVSVHIKVNETDDEANLITEFIKTATELVEDYIQRQLMQATWEYQMADFCKLDAQGYLTLWKAPLVSITSVKYFDSDNEEQTLAPSEYQVDTTSLPGRIRFNGNIPGVYDRPDAVKIRFVAGYGNDGDDAGEQRTAISDYRASRAITAILRCVADFYEHRQDESRDKAYLLNENIKAWLTPLRLY